MASKWDHSVKQDLNLNIQDRIHNLLALFWTSPHVLYNSRNLKSEIAIALSGSFESELTVTW